MRGKNVSCSFGTDDNGLPTERLVEKMKNVKGKKMQRKEFVDLCLKTLEEITPDFIYDWKRIGVSADYSINYSTINPHCQKISQRSFLELFKNDRIYRNYAPIIFCPHCQTAIAQVEMEDKQSKSTLNFIKAKSKDRFFIYATTRPEVLYGCVGFSIAKDGTYVEIDVSGEKWIVSKDSLITLTKHDIKFTIIKEFKGEELVGEEVTIPIANITVNVTHDEVTKTEFGTGMVYYCTYGGFDCVEWLTRHEGVEPKIVMGTSGKYSDECGEISGLGSEEARKIILEKLEKGRPFSFQRANQAHCKCP